MDLPGHGESSPLPAYSPRPSSTRSQARAGARARAPARRRSLAGRPHGDLARRARTGAIDRERRPAAPARRVHRARAPDRARARRPAVHGGAERGDGGARRPAASRRRARRPAPSYRVERTGPSCSGSGCRWSMPTQTGSPRSSSHCSHRCALPMLFARRRPGRGLRDAGCASSSRPRRSKYGPASDTGCTGFGPSAFSLGYAPSTPLPSAQPLQQQLVHPLGLVEHASQWLAPSTRSYRHSPPMNFFDAVICGSVR